MLPSPIHSVMSSGAEPSSLADTACEEIDPREAVDAFLRDGALPLSPQVLALLDRADALTSRILDASLFRDIEAPPSLAERLDPADMADIVSLLRAMPARLWPSGRTDVQRQWMSLLRDPVGQGRTLPHGLGALLGLKSVVRGLVSALNRLNRQSPCHDPAFVTRLSALVRWEERRGLEPGTHLQIISDALKSKLWSEERGHRGTPKTVPLDNPTHAPVWPPLDVLRQVGPAKDGLRLCLGYERPAIEQAREFSERAAAAGTEIIEVDLRAGEAWPEAFCIDGVYSVKVRADDQATLEAALAEIARRMPGVERLDFKDERHPLVVPDVFQRHGDTLKRDPAHEAWVAGRRAGRPTLGGGLALL